ncbi:MAG TPA: ABC transporter substrate-binding protein, partial [Caldilineaceae bacterium]|nr:ABC transporter substrate-binding protein [Caldilineaceae bacterium]
MSRWRRARPWLAGAGIAAVMVVVLLRFLPGMDEPSRLLTRLLFRQDETWAGMVERGVWRVGLDPSFPPFEALDDTGQPAGYDVDLARRMAAVWGMEVEIIAIGYDSLLDALKADRVDSVVSALPYDPRATRDVAFSSPYFEAGVRLAVRAGDPLAAPEELAGRRVAVEWGSASDMAGRRLQREGIGLELVAFETPAAAVDALVNDPTIDALLIDQVSLRLAQGQGAAVVAVGPALESNPYVIAVPLHATTLQERVEETLAQLAAGGEL